MKTKTSAPPPGATAFRDDLLNLLKAHSGHLPADAMLALASYTVGQLVAFQDQRRFTPEAVMQLVQENIVLGNQNAVSMVTTPSTGKGH